MKRKRYYLAFLLSLFSLFAFSQIEIDTRSMLREMDRGRERKYDAFVLPPHPALLLRYDFSLEESWRRKEKYPYTTAPLSAYYIRLKPCKSLFFNLGKPFRFTVGPNWHYNLSSHRWEYMPALNFSFTF